MANKKISELPFISGNEISSTDLIPLVTYFSSVTGDTVHTLIGDLQSTITSANTVTYSQLLTLINNSGLTIGSNYLMTDFQTVYDQPNYDQNGSPITTGNNKSGTTEPLLLLAVSTTGFSPTVYSTLYPNDKITYDISWNTTEVTNTPAKGRITERIDGNNNRADYDFRAVQFIRYVGFFSEQYLPGKIDLDATTGLVSGTTTGTTFLSSFIVGDILGVYNPNGLTPTNCFKYYEITSIVSDIEMYVTGRTLTSVNNVYYSRGLTLPNYMNPFQCNVTGGTYDDSAEYYTFNSGINYNTYMGDNINYDTFILSNNVFQNGSYNNNTFGGNFVGNTLNDDMDSNIIGPYCQYNILTNDFDRNNVGSYFQYNIIDCDMESNQIGNYFENNMLGDANLQDFDFNTIGPRFSGNFLTLNNNDFINNKIGYSFYNNLIDGGFRNNEIVGNFYDNLITNSDFENNTIGDTFYSNIIPTNFSRNTIGQQFYQNNIYSQFTGNTFGENVYVNTFGNPNSIGTYSFIDNTIGSVFTNNYFSGNTQGNVIGYGCNSNNIDTNFSQNQIGNGFANNTIANDFGFGGANYRGNIVGNGFNGNTVGEYCYDNTFGDECTSNNLSDYFTNNKVSYGFNNVIINNLDTPGSTFENNNFTYGYFTGDLTLTGGTGGNPIFYSVYPTNVTKDAGDTNNYVTFLSGGTIVAQTITV